MPDKYSILRFTKFFFVLALGRLVLWVWFTPHTRENEIVYRKLVSRSLETPQAAQRRGTDVKLRLSGTTVCIVMTTYNVEEYVEKSILSVFRQTFQQWELIVVDDTSSDKTFEISSRYADLYPDRVRVYQVKHAGTPAKARNLALRMCKGDLIMPLDGDDVLPVKSLEKSVKAFEKNPTADAVLGTIVLFNSADEALLGTPELDPILEYKCRKYNAKMMLRENSIANTCLIRKSMLERKGYSDVIPIAEDWKVWIDIQQYYGVPHLVCINEPTLYYRRNKPHRSRNDKNIPESLLGSLMVTLTPAAFQMYTWPSHRKVVAKYHEFIGHKAAVALTESSVCHGIAYFWRGIYHEGEGKLEKALQMYRKALACQLEEAERLQVIIACRDISNVMRLEDSDHICKVGQERTGLINSVLITSTITDFGLTALGWRNGYISFPFLWPTRFQEAVWNGSGFELPFGGKVQRTMAKPSPLHDAVIRWSPQQDIFSRWQSPNLKFVVYALVSCGDGMHGSSGGLIVYLFANGFGLERKHCSPYTEDVNFLYSFNAKELKNIEIRLNSNGRSHHDDVHYEISVFAT